MLRERIGLDGAGRCCRRDCLIGWVKIEILGWVGKTGLAVFEMVGSGVHYYDEV